MQILDGIKSISNGINQMTVGMNPFVTTMTKENADIASHLLDSGVTVEQIRDFIDVSTVEFDQWAELEVEVRKRIEQSKTRKPRKTA